MQGPGLLERLWCLDCANTWTACGRVDGCVRNLLQPVTVVCELPHHLCALAARRYKQLLLKQRDIMIALTARLNERDEQIMTLQVRVCLAAPCLHRGAVACIAHTAGLGVQVTWRAGFLALPARQGS